MVQQTHRIVAVIVKAYIESLILNYNDQSWIKKSLFGVFFLVQLLLSAVLISNAGAYQQFDLSQAAYFNRVKEVLKLKPEHEAMLAQ